MSLANSNVNNATASLNETRPARNWAEMLKHWSSTAFNHVKIHTGVGIICAVAYFDPGNWGVDLQAGSEYGYRLLFVVLLAGLCAVFLQVLASRLGCVTGMDLASHCRLLLHDRPRHTKLCRWLVLYPLYALSEIAIISTDLAELLGSAIALCLIFPRLPLWSGVLITGLDVLFILALGDPLGGRPVRMFEFLIAAMVLAVLVCMAIIIGTLNVNWADAFNGFIPSKQIFQNGALYTSVGIIGATVMPHSLFLGSTLATQDRISRPPPKILDVGDSAEINPETRRSTRSRSAFRACLDYFYAAFRVPPRIEGSSGPKMHGEHSNNSISFVNAHLNHGILDMVISLLGFAVVINAMILILAASVFFYGSKESGSSSSSPAGLFDAHDLIRDKVGKGAALLFAFALLAAGQSSSIIATVAGQAVSEGFLRWRVSPVVRRLLTRVLGLVPSMIVAVAGGRQGIDTLLVASQVVLSICLPFITLPLLYLTSSRAVMSVRDESTAVPTLASIVPATRTPEGRSDSQLGDLEQRAPGTVDFSNGKFSIGVGSVIWLVIVVANLYVIVELARGGGS